jgi:PAS domain S-box-containing protein
LEAQSKKTDNLADRIQLIVSLPLWNLDRDYLQELVSQELKDPELSAIVILNQNNELFVGKTRKEATDNELTDLTSIAQPRLASAIRTIKRDGQKIGTVKLYATETYINKELSRDLMFQLFQGLFMLLSISYLVYLGMNRIIVVPLIRLSEVTSKLEQGKLYTRITGLNDDEIGRLGFSINSMAESLEKAGNELKKRKELLDAVMDNTFQFQGLLAFDGTLLNANKTSLDLIGACKEAVVGHLFWETPWWAHDYKEQLRLKDAIARCQQGETCHYETTHRDVSGNIRYFDFSLKPLYADTGSIIYLIPEGRDITDLKNRETAIREREEQLRLYLQRLPIACILWGTDYRVQSWNPAAERIFGFTEAEALGKTANELIVPESVRSQVDKVWGRINQGELDAGSINENSTRDGRKILCEWTNTPCFDGAGNVAGIISVAQDISDRKQAETAMIQSEKMAMIAGMAAGMAHEVNNPLGIIAQDLQNLERRFSPALPANCKIAAELGLNLDTVEVYMERRDISKYVSSMRSAVKRASNIISNMLQFSRQSDSSHQLCDLNDVIEQSIKLALNDYDLRKKYDFMNVSISREFDHSLPKISVCITEMEQVFINILKNAAQAMIESNTSLPSIVIRTFLRNGHVVAVFQDNGPGMSDDVNKRIFDPFFTTKDIGAGTGLGLSVSFTIVTKNHGGELTVESKLGQGACFIIKLPIYAV